MSDERSKEERRRARLRWITLGEAIAIAALLVSGLGLWHEWNNRNDNRPTEVVEKRSSVPLTLRGRAVDEGQTLEIAPVESSHALQSLTITVPGSSAPIEIGSDGELQASDFEAALGKDADRGKGTHRLRAKIETRYVEAGADRRSSGTYVLSYRWEGGGLFSDRSLRFVGISR